ncbi:EAL domain-containing protein [Roseospira visakhapatnamensis]|uniref:EAL domain-containing protein n=1 Tax=Roseospira visakhapatnamensis TaxID=390880 RepID=A0A7W6RB63_9PROT|nr:EAL domain-containing protein [Roseospira visakhapatnamensis]MBB4265237.1 hypothetical protein [Roseospira visakhapatnamensis]
MARMRAIRSGFALPDYVREIGGDYYDLRSLRVRVSDLRPENRAPDSLRAIEEALTPLALDGLARLFRLPEGDYLLIFRKEVTDRVRAVLVGLRFLISDDPLSEHLGAPAGQDTPLLIWRDLGESFEALRALASEYERIAAKRAEAAARRDGTRAGQATGDAARALAEAEEADHDDKTAAAGAGVPGVRPPLAEGAVRPDTDVPAAMVWRPIGPRTDQPPSPDPAALWTAQPWAGPRGSWGGRRPIDAEVLDRLENGLAQADLSNHVRWQRVCAIVGTAPPRPVFTEIYVSIPELRETIAPRIDLTANRWLFQHFTETLDRRVLAYLNREGVRTSKDGFSVNLNVQTILSDTFLRFEQVLAAGTHGTVVLELRVEDVFSDLDAYVFARDYVRQRGYRLCIDALDPETLGLLDRARLGADLVKLFWTRDLPARMITDDGLALARRLRAGEGSRTVLAHCDSAEAVTLGQDLGITLFQGRSVDDLQGIIDDSVPMPRGPRR